MSMQLELRGTGKSNPMVRTAWVWLVAAVGMAVAGCGQSSFRSGPDYPVKGKILLADGKPLRSGQVVFVSSETALSYAGPIGDDGGFELKQGDRVGAPAGNYKVRIEINESSFPKRPASLPICLSRPSIGTRIVPSRPPRSRPNRRMPSSSSSPNELHLRVAGPLRSLERFGSQALPRERSDRSGLIAALGPVASPIDAELAHPGAEGMRIDGEPGRGTVGAFNPPFRAG